MNPDTIRGGKIAIEFFVDSTNTNIGSVDGTPNNNIIAVGVCTPAVSLNATLGRFVVLNYLIREVH